MKKMNIQEVHERLLPEIREYVEATSLGLWLKHPLVNTPLVAEVFDKTILGAKDGAELTNTKLSSKRASIEEAWKAGDWHSYIFLHERYARLSALKGLIEATDIRNPWPLVAEVWSDSENIRHEKRAWRGV